MRETTRWVASKERMKESLMRLSVLLRSFTNPLLELINLQCLIKDFLNRISDQLDEASLMGSPIQNRLGKMSRNKNMESS
jgi:hypothetical protein